MNSKAYKLLSIAIRKNSFELAKKVLKKDPSVIIDEQWSDYTLLIKALQRGRKRIAILLLVNGCRVNRTSKTNFYFTPLYYAVRLGDIKLVSLLLDKDALINGKDKNQNSVLCLAMKMKYFKIVELLLSKYCHQTTLMKGDNHDDLTAYFIAIMTHHKSYFRETFGRDAACTQQINDELKLHYAVEDRSPELARVLIDCGADITERNAKGSTALHVAFLSHVQENPKYMTDPLMDQIVKGHTEKTENCIDSNGISHFHIACTRDNPEIVKCFLRQRVNIHETVPKNSKFLGGFTPLHFAAHFKRKSVIKLLLENNANTTIVDNEGSTPLHVAFLASIDPRENSNNEVMDLLLTRVSDNKQDFVNTKGISYLHIASHRNNIEVVKNLIIHGADVNQAISFMQNFFSGYTPLHFAVKNKNLDLIKLLLEYKADINAPNGKKFTPLHEAWFQKNHYTNSEIDDSIIDVLLSAHDINSKNSLDKCGFSHLHIACARKNPDAVRNLLQKNKSGINRVSRASKYFGSCTPLYCAVKYNRAPNVKLLLEHGADVNGGEFTSPIIPLDQACMFNYAKVCDLLQKEVKDELLASDHSLDHSKNISDWISNRNDQLEIIKLLLEYKSDVNTKCHVYGPILFHLYDLVLNDGFIDFLNCCRTPRFRKFCDQIVLREFLIRRAAIVKIFVEYNFNVNLRDHRGESFLHKLCRDYDNDIENACIAELFLKNGANVDARNDMNVTPIHYAIHTGQRGVVEVFLKYNANLNSVDYTGHTPLHLICRNQTFHAHQVPILDIRIIKQLITDENINSKNKEGKTPLFIACENGLNTVVIELLRYGGDVNIKDNDGRTVLHFFSKCNPFSWRRVKGGLELFTIIYEHIQKLKGIGFFISKTIEKLTCILQNLFGLPPGVPSKYLEEIAKLKNIRVDNYSSLYDIIFKDPNQMAIHVKNDYFTQILNSRDFDDKFPLYGYLLKLQFQRGTLRATLLSSAKRVLRSILNYEFPDACFENILKYFNNDNIRELLKIDKLLRVI